MNTEEQEGETWSPSWTVLHGQGTIFLPRYISTVIYILCLADAPPRFEAERAFLSVASEGPADAGRDW